jgi:TonB family protein
MSVVAETQLLLPADPAIREARERQARFGRLRRGAIVAAALLHAAVIAAFLLRWPFSGAEPPEQPPISVALVTELPKPPPPTPPASPPRQPPHDLVSGPDQTTAAPPQAEAKGPHAAPKPQPEKEEKQKTAALAEPKPSPPAAPRAKPAPKEASREMAPAPRQRGSVDRAPGETKTEGDPYLNHVWAMIEQHRTYPAYAIGPLGLRLEGTVVYLIAVSPAGALQGIRLERSSGAPVLDSAARAMIEAAAPFPPLPSYFPRAGATLTVTSRIFATAS